MQWRRAELRPLAISPRHLPRHPPPPSPLAISPRHLPSLSQARAEALRAPMSPILRSLSERDIHSRVSAQATVLAQEPSPAVSQASNFVRVVGGFT